METKNVEKKKYLTITGTTTLSQLYEVADREVDGLYEECNKVGLEKTGPIEFIYIDSSSDILKPFTLMIALPVKEEKPLKSKKYTFKELDNFKCLSHIHNGSLSEIPGVYGNLFEEIHKKGILPTNEVREVYEKFEGMDSTENIIDIQIGII